MSPKLSHSPIRPYHFAYSAPSMTSEGNQLMDRVFDQDIVVNGIYLLVLHMTSVAS